MSQKLSHLNLPMIEVPRSSNMFGLDDTGDGINLGNIYYHQSVTERHPNLVLKYSYLKNILNISILDGGKESEQGKLGVDVTELITYKNSFVINVQPVTVSIDLGEGVACNTIFHGCLCKQ